MKKETLTKGWKVFNKDLKCRNCQFEVGNRYKQNGTLIMCKHGYHFHTNPNDLFEYYDFTPENRVCEIIAHGKVISQEDKSCCNDIEIIRELSWNDVLNLVNTGKGNSGRNNSGNCNSGSQNSGDCNSGYWNSGYWNSGYWNSGDWNSGSQNSGYCNSGYRNSGDWNSGSQNSGYRNSGYFNKANYCSGIFNSEEQPVPLFNGAATVMMSEFRNSKAFHVITSNDFQLTEWISKSNMTDQEKIDHPKFYVMEGYLKVNTYKYACRKWWEGLSSGEKSIIMDIPGFNKEIFFTITGIKID
jgi:hypothetical protein